VTAHPAPPTRLRRAAAAPARGFTLVEVMVALFVMAVLAGMAWQGVDLVVKSRSSAAERVGRWLQLQSVLSQWDADLRELVDTQTVPAFAFDGAALRLTRRQAEGAQVVVWVLRDAVLRRWATPATSSSETLQEAWLRGLQLPVTEPGQLAMQTGVQGWQLHVFSQRSQSWSNALSTGDIKAPAAAPGASAPAATGADRNALPDGVRLIVQFNPAAAATAGTAGGAAPPGGGFDGTLTHDVQVVHP
jgi:general secretion pathway protein J